MSKTCNNCEYIFDSSFNYCPNCGQKSNEGLTVGVLFKNTIHNYFSVDARFFKSFFPLLVRPGFLPSKFVEGKRLLYLHPAQFYLFASLVFFFLFSFEVRKQETNFDKVLKKEAVTTPKDHKPRETVQIGNSNFNVVAIGDTITPVTDYNDLKLENKKVDSLIAHNAPEIEVLKALGMKDDASWFQRKFYGQLYKLYKYKSGGSILETFYNYIPISLFILLPIFALLLKLVYFRKGVFAVHLVFSLYYFSFLFVLLSLFTILHFFIKLPNIIYTVITLLSFVYLYLAVLKFYKSGLFSSFFKVGFVSTLYALLVIPMAFVILAVAAFMFY
ncbi:DUF3667 domain-containing protein [Formosa sp. S-31]|uniref:DUF3667 domain-containing protein n=1 Tax=Formosa sp. S-31 TaxID=2790949 RepID=UPI003EBDE757